MRVPRVSMAGAGHFLAGVLVANSLPHLATAVTGRRHFTPLAGGRSSPSVNLVWAAGNLAGGCLLLRGVRSRDVPGGVVETAGSRWDSGLLAFEAGALSLCVWMLVTEAATKLNHTAA